MDQSNLDTQMMEEDSKTGSLRCTILTPDLVEAIGKKTALTNDITYGAEPFLIKWHKRVLDMLKWKFWNCPVVEMREKLKLASEAFVHFDLPNNIDRLTTKKAIEGVLKKEWKFAVEYSNQMLGYIKDWEDLIIRMFMMLMYSLSLSVLSPVFGEMISQWSA